RERLANQSLMRLGIERAPHRPTSRQNGEVCHLLAQLHHRRLALAGDGFQGLLALLVDNLSGLLDLFLAETLGDLFGLADNLLTLATCFGDALGKLGLGALGL